MRLNQTIPAMPVRGVEAACAFCRDRLGFRVRHKEPAYPVLERDNAESHRWQADHEPVPHTADVPRPVRGGVTSTDFGTREFACLDTDGNQVTFFRRTP